MKRGDGVQVQHNQPSQSTHQIMSATIMMPAALELSIKSMCDDAVAQAVATLAEKHGFDSEEALRDVNIGEIKLVRKRGPSPKSEKKLAGKPKKDADAKPKTKRGATGYQMFMKDERPAAKKHLDETNASDAKVPATAVMTELGARWKALSEEARGVWNTQAKEVKDAASSAASSLTSSVIASEDDEPIKVDEPIKDDEPLSEIESDEEAEVDPEVAKAAAKAEAKIAAKAVAKAEAKIANKAGYKYFHKEIAAELAEELAVAGDGKKIAGADVAKASAKQWTALDDDKKRVWIEKASV